MVARVTLHDMCQDRDEPVQAVVCKFTIKCPNCSTDVNYIITCVRADSNAQLGLLGVGNQNITPEETHRSQRGWQEISIPSFRSLTHWCLSQQL